MDGRIRVFLTLVICFTVVYGSAAFLILSPRPSQPFFGFGVFSDSGSLSDYLPGSGPYITTNSTVNWHFEVFNRMGVVQFVQIVLRIGNGTSNSPGPSDPDSTVPVLGTLERFIPNQDTATIDFSWRILSVSRIGGLMFPLLQINDGTPVPSGIGSSSGQDFRFIFELWTYDLDSATFQYGWRDGSSIHGSWLQVWFKIV